MQFLTLRAAGENFKKAIFRRKVNYHILYLTQNICLKDKLAFVLKKCLNVFYTPKKTGRGGEGVVQQRKLFKILYTGFSPLSTLFPQGFAIFRIAECYYQFNSIQFNITLLSKQGNSQHKIIFTRQWQNRTVIHWKVDDVE